MAKYFGNIGYAETVEVKPGVWKETITERPYFGDTMRISRRLVTSGVINSGVDISNQISIVSDPYAHENFHAIRYAECMGAEWTVSNIEVQYPRLILTLGGVYNVE